MILKNPEFRKYSAVDNVSAIIEQLEKDLIVSSYSVKETKRIVCIFDCFVIEATHCR